MFLLHFSFILIFIFFLILISIAFLLHFSFPFFILIVTFTKGFNHLAQNRSSGLYIFIFFLNRIIILYCCNIYKAFFSFTFFPENSALGGDDKETEKQRKKLHLEAGDQEEVGVDEKNPRLRSEPTESP